MQWKFVEQISYDNFLRIGNVEIFCRPTNSWQFTNVRFNERISIRTNNLNVGEHISHNGGRDEFKKFVLTS